MKRILCYIAFLMVSSSILKAQTDSVVWITATADTVCTGESVTLQVSLSGDIVAIPQVAIGDILCTDGSFVKPSDWASSGQTAQGVVFYVDSTGAHGWAVNVNGQTPSVKWSISNEDVPNLTNRSSFLPTADILSQYLGDYNTQCIRAAGDAINFPAAYVVDFDDGWFVPDIVQLNVLMSEYYFVNPTFQMLGCTFNMTQNYWSSTEHSAGKSWMMNVSGSMRTESKTASHLVLGIRNF